MAAIEAAFSDDDMRSGARSTLGPAYYASIRFAEHLVQEIQAQDLNPILKEVGKKLDEVLQDALVALCENAESNVQHFIWQNTDATVRALLTGEEWAVNKYVFAALYDGEKIRKAIADQFPDQIRNARIADLEAEIDRLRKDLDWYRRP